MAPHFVIVVEFVSLLMVLSLLLIELFVASGSVADGGVTVVAAAVVVSIVVVKTATEPFSPFIFYFAHTPKLGREREKKNTILQWLQCTQTRTQTHVIHFTARRRRRRFFLLIFTIVSNAFILALQEFLFSFFFVKYILGQVSMRVFFTVNISTRGTNYVFIFI